QYLAMTPLNIQSAEMQQKYQQLNVWLRGKKLAEVYQQ
ncbi:phospholipase, partial [Yersinia enterocolitica]|nr:phospholipase [Yersinia enterocolitica]